VIVIIIVGILLIILFLLITISSPSVLCVDMFNTDGRQSILKYVVRWEVME
jgi:hypothetical protein